MFCCPPLTSGPVYVNSFPSVTGFLRSSRKPFGSSSTTWLLQVCSATCNASATTSAQNNQYTHCLHRYYGNMQRLPTLPDEGEGDRCTEGRVAAGIKKSLVFLKVGPEARCWRPEAGARTRSRSRAGSASGCYVKSASATTTLRKTASHI